MKLFLRSFSILCVTAYIYADHTQNAFSKEEFNLMYEKLKESNDTEIQQAKETANYFITLINAGKEAGMKDGEAPDREAELVMMDAVFPMMQEKDLKQARIRVAFSLKCFAQADTLESANRCNKKANKLSKIFLDDFKKWDEEVKANTLEHLRRYVPCLQDAIDAEELSNCHTHIYQ